MPEERRKNYPSILNAIKRLEGQMALVLKILNGNGKVGLVAMVNRNTDNVKDLMNDRKVTFSKIFDWTLKIGLSILLLIVTSILATKL